jgi:hypothetical protein
MKEGVNPPLFIDVYLILKKIYYFPSFFLVGIKKDVSL